MSDDSKVTVRLRLLGAQLMSRDAKRAAGGLKSLDQGGRNAARGLGQIRGGKVQSEMGLISRGTVLAKQGMRGVEKGAIAAARALRVVGVGAGVLASAGLISVIKSSTDFEQQMANVQSRLMTTKGNMKLLTAQALDLGAKTQFSAGQAAGGMDQLAAAGFSTQQILKTLPGTLSLAAASGTDLAFAAELQGAAIRGFGLRASDASHVADVLAQTVNKSALEMSDLGDTLPYVASTARQTGTSFEQVAAAAGILGNAGIKGSMAGTALRTSMLRLTDPTKRIQTRLHLMGLSAKELAAQPLPKVIGLIAAGLRKLPTRGAKVGAISAIFGKESAPAMLNLMAKGKAGIDRMTRSLEHSKGAAERAAKIMRSTVKGAWDNFTGSLETASIRLTRRFQPAMRQALNAAASGVNKLTDALPGVASAFSAGVTGKSVVASAPRTQVIPDRVGDSAPPPSKAQQFAAKAGAVLRGLIPVAKQIGTALVTAGKQLLDAFKPALPFLQNILLPLLKGIAMGVIGSVVGAFQVLIPIIKLLATVLGFIGKVAAPLKPVFQAIGLVIGIIFSGAILKALGAMRRIGIVFRIMAIPIRLLGVVFRGVGTAVRAVAGSFSSALRAVQLWVGTFTSAPARVARAALNIVGGIVHRFSTMPHQVAQKISDVIDVITNLLGTSVGRVVRAAGNIGRGILRGIVNAIKSAPAAIAGMLASVVDHLPIPGFVKGKIKDVLGAHAQGGVVRSPLQVVGEHGPELAAMPVGSRVIPASDTRRMMRGGRQPTTMLPDAHGGALYAHLVVNLDGKPIHSAVHKVERQKAETR